MTDLIEKAADKLKRAGQASLVERAAGALGAEGAPATQTPAGGVAPPPLQTPASPLSRRAETPGGGRRISKYAEIDLSRLEALGILTNLNDRSRVAEEFRIIKRPLLRKAFGTNSDRVERGNLIMVVSAAPDDGKTFTAVNLAMSIALERDKHVLLVDADLRNPQILKTLGIEADIGLVDVLEEKAELAETLIRTNVPRLTILPSGRGDWAGSELLSSGRMGEVVEEIAHRYPDRVVIFDTGPMLGSSEASALAMHVGQVAFVVQAERTTQAEVESSLELLSPCKEVGLILNKARTRHRSDQFGSYYRKRKK